MVPLAARNIPHRVQQAALHNGFSHLEAVYPHTIKGLFPPIVPMLCGPSVILVFVINGIPQMTPLISLILFLIAGAISVMGLLMLIRKWTLNVYVFQEGAIITKAGRCLTFPWSSTRFSERLSNFWIENSVKGKTYIRVYQIESAHARYKFYEIDVKNVEELSATIKNKS